MSSFQRLIRFASPTGQIYYGEAPSMPCTPCASDLIGAKVRIYTGNPISAANVQLSNEEAEVAEVLSPLEQVPIFYGIGLNYRKHVLEANFPIPEFPILFTKPPDALAGPYEDILIDPQLQDLDYEGELCFVIGQDIKDFPAAADPAPVILGYTAGNDISSRYWQQPPRSGQQHGYAKSFDRFAPLGPLLVSPAVIVDPSVLTLTTWYWDERNFIAHFINPDGGTMLESGALVPMGPTWGKKSEEWTIHFGFGMDDVKRFEEDLVAPRIRQLLKIPDLDIKVLKISHWELECVLANKYRAGRIFLAGDSCHRHPPTTGLGLNGAIEDAHNLAWKLALHLSGATGPELLDTYETERRPVGRRNCDWGLFTFMNTAVINAAVGLIPGQKERNRMRFQGLFADSPSGRTQRAQVNRIIGTQEIEFRAHDLELGFHYDSGALISDGSEIPMEDPLGQQYIPTTRPGHRLPHAWLQHKDSNAGKLVSTHDLVGKTSDFLLITGDMGEPWVRASQECAAITGLRIRAAQIGGLGGQPMEYLDYDSTWTKVSQLSDGGAILVRPDTIVAWRSNKCNPGGETKKLLEVINTILNRSVGDQSQSDTN